MLARMRLVALSVCLLHAVSICWAASIGSSSDPSLESNYPGSLSSLPSATINTQYVTFSVVSSSEQHPSIIEPSSSRQIPSEQASEVSNSTTSTSTTSTTIASDPTIYDDVDDDNTTISSGQGQIEPTEHGAQVGSTTESTLTSTTTSTTTETDDSDEEPEEGVVILIVSTIEEVLEEMIDDDDDELSQESLQEGVSTTPSTQQPVGTTASSPQSEPADEGDDDDDDSDEDDSDEDDSDEDDSYEYEDEDDYEYKSKRFHKKGEITSIDQAIQKDMTEYLDTTKSVVKGCDDLPLTIGDTEETKVVLDDVGSDVNLQIATNKEADGGKLIGNFVPVTTLLDTPMITGDIIMQGSNIDVSDEGKLIDEPSLTVTLMNTPKEIIKGNTHSIKVPNKRVQGTPLKLAAATTKQLDKGIVTPPLDIGGVDETKLIDTSFKTMDGQRKVIVPIVPELINKPL